LKIIKHENFPQRVAQLIRQFELLESDECTIQFPIEEYGDNVAPGEWMSVIGKPTAAHRPIVLTMDTGVRGNAVGIKAMKESRCSFVCLEHGWSKKPLQEFAWRILKAWPEIVKKAKEAHDTEQHCKIGVTINGKPYVTNL